MPPSCLRLGICLAFQGILIIPQPFFSHKDKFKQNNPDLLIIIIAPRSQPIIVGILHIIIAGRMVQPIDFPCDIKHAGLEVFVVDFKYTRKQTTLRRANERKDVPVQPGKRRLLSATIAANCLHVKANLSRDPPRGTRLQSIGRSVQRSRPRASPMQCLLWTRCMSEGPERLIMWLSRIQHPHNGSAKPLSCYRIVKGFV
jgi:hypothetical protein